MMIKPAPLDIRRILNQFDLRLHKGLGQNVLVDEDALQRILAVAGIDPGDTVLEIGPGLGSLTRYLALNAGKVVAIEIDERLFPALKTTLAPYQNIQLVAGDILKVVPSELVDQDRYLVVANIPYYITSAVIQHLLESKIRPRRMVLTVQKEVAERICAVNGKMSLLALSVQVYGKPEISTIISSSSFYPSPKVDSAVVRLDVYDAPLIPETKLQLFFRLAKAGFGQKRKTIRNALGTLYSREQVNTLLESAGIDPLRRAETLSMDEWASLTEAAQA